MKTIADMTGAEFLRACNNIRHEAADLVKKSGVLKLRSNLPKFTGKETEEERRVMLAKQSRKNISDMLDRLLDEYAEETAALLEKMVTPDEGESVTGLDLAMAGLDIVTTPKVINFLSKLVQLVPNNMEH